MTVARSRRSRRSRRSDPRDAGPRWTAVAVAALLGVLAFTTSAGGLGALGLLGHLPVLAVQLLAVLAAAWAVVRCRRTIATTVATLDRVTLGAALLVSAFVSLRLASLSVLPVLPGSVFALTGLLGGEQRWTAGLASGLLPTSSLGRWGTAKNDVVAAGVEIVAAMLALVVRKPETRDEMSVDLREQASRLSPDGSVLINDHMSLVFDRPTVNTNVLHSAEWDWDHLTVQQLASDLERRGVRSAVIRGGISGIHPVLTSYLEQCGTTAGADAYVVLWEIYENCRPEP